MKVLGVDLFSGSVNSKTQPRYSVVLLEDGEVALREEVSRYKLIRLIRDEKPDRVACDNVYELFQKKKTKGFFYLLPHGTKLLQVNGTPVSSEPLHVVAKKHGIRITSKASSMEEAEACAFLGSRNVGYTAEMFSDEGRVVVSRARSMGKGGQSQDRYRRKVHERVGQKIKEIEGIFKEGNLSYELSKVRADYGYSRGEFRVKAPLAALKDVKKSSGPDVQVKKLMVEREGLEFIPLEVRKKGVIVGIDPGTTTGVAVLDLHGGLCEVFSTRDFSVNDTLAYLTKYEEVVVVASDVTPAPKFVEKVSASLKATLFTPSKTLSVADKKELVISKFSKDAYRNSHERDALAAALKAFNYYRNKLEQVEKRLDELNMGLYEKEVKKKVIEGRSIAQALEALGSIHEEEKREEKIEADAPKEYKALIRTLKEDVKVLREEVDSLKKGVKSKDRRIRALRGRLKEAEKGELGKIIQQREIRRREREIVALKGKLGGEKRLREFLQEKINRLQRARLVEYSGDLALVKVIPRFTKDEVTKAKEIKKGDLIWIHDPVGGGPLTAEKLLELKPRAIIAEKEKISEPVLGVLRDVIILSPEKVKVNIVEDYGIVDKAVLEEEMSKEQEKMKLREAAEKREWLEGYLEKYKQRRS